MSDWKITYLGEGVAQLDGVGNFQKHTTATVTAEVATRLKGDGRWQIVGPGGAPVGAAAPAPRAEEKPAPAPKVEEKPAPAPAPKAEGKPAPAPAPAKADEKATPAVKVEEKPAAKDDGKKAEKPADAPKA